MGRNFSKDAGNRTRDGTGPAALTGKRAYVSRSSIGSVWRLREIHAPYLTTASKISG